MIKTKSILVTGLIRSGTTWIGKSLAKVDNCYYIHEPLHPGKGFSFSPVKDFFPHISEEQDVLNNREFEKFVFDIINFKLHPFGDISDPINSPRRRRLMLLGHRIRNSLKKYDLVIKDPSFLFSAEWLENLINCQVVVVIRHPAAFCYSMRKAKWGKFNMDTFLNQTKLMEDHLADFKDEMIKAKSEYSELENHILSWRFTNHYIREMKKKHINWIFVRQEDFARDPSGNFAKLYELLGLNLTDQISSEFIRESQSKESTRLERSSTQTINEWKENFSRAEIELIKENASDVWPAFYTETDWQ